MSPPTPETISIITVESGSTRICRPTSKSPAASQVYAVETTSRSSGLAAHVAKKATTAPPKATNVVSVEMSPAVRREIRPPATAIASAPASGESRQTQPPAAISRAPRRHRLPPGGARLRRRLTTLAARGSPGPYSSYRALRHRTASGARGTRLTGFGPSSAKRARLVDVEGHVAAGHGDDEPEADRDLCRRDGHDRQREHLSVERALLARERDQRQAPRVQHDLEREEHDQRAASHHDAERADPEEQRRDDQVPADARPHHGRPRSFSEPSTTPPTAATSRTIEVISNASRWSVRKSSPIAAGLPNESGTSAGLRSESPQARPRTTTTSTRSAPAATTAAVRSSGGPPAQGASARPPR